MSKAVILSSKNMLCDELKVYVPQDGPWGLEPEEGGKLVEEETCYLKSEVDAAIAELKQKLEDAKATAYADSVDAGMENRRRKRALWLARANRALDKIAWFKLWNSSISTMNPEDGARQEFDKWKKNLCKFLKKAEEYK